MSGHRTGHLAKPSHALRIAAIATVIAAALTTCTSTAAGAGAAQSSTAAANTTSTLTITGAGSTFDAPFFGTAFARYQQQHPGAAISYCLLH
jgi:ABC-type phosphate transport system substrate-binding protein